MLATTTKNGPDDRVNFDLGRIVQGLDADGNLESLADAVGRGVAQGGGAPVTQGKLFAMPDDSTDGAEIGGTRPSATSGIRLYVPTSGSLTYFIDAAGVTESGAPDSTVTVGPGVYDEPLSSADSIYVTATTGSVLGRWVK